MAQFDNPWPLSPPWEKLQNFCVNCYHKSKKAGEGEENSVKYPCRYQQILAVSLWSKRKPCLTCRTWVHSKQIEFDKLFIKLSLRSQMKFWNLQFFTCSHWNINTWSSSSLKFILFPTCTESSMWFIFYPYSIIAFNRSTCQTSAAIFDPCALIL